MDLTRILTQLKHELDHIDAAIVSLERLQAKETRRGRPPKILADLRRLKPVVRRVHAREAQRRTDIA
jgi:hypothetical protein